MAGDFYKQILIFVGFSILLATMDSGVQSAFMLQDIKSSLQEITFNVDTTNVNTTIDDTANDNTTDTNNFDITVSDYYTNDILYEVSILIFNTTQYPVTVSNLTSGSLFRVEIQYSNDEGFNGSIATKPDAVKGLNTINILFTSAQIEWEAYIPPQKGADKPKYWIGSINATEIEETNRNLTRLKPKTEYPVSVSVLLYNLSSEFENITFTTLTVPPPIDTKIVAVDTSSLNVSWTISKSNPPYPEYVNISSQIVSVSCQYKDGFCIINVDQTPGKLHTISIFSVVETYPSTKENISHNTIPLPPLLSNNSTSTSLTITVSPDNSDFDLYFIDFINTTESKNISRDGNNTVSVQYPNLQPKTGYHFKVYTSSGTEFSEKTSKMFFTNPSLDLVNVSSKGNSVHVSQIGDDYENCTMCLYNNSDSRCKQINGNNVTFENVPAGYKYSLNVSCYSKWSEPKQVVVPPLPASNVRISATSNSIFITWDFDYNKSAVDRWFISIDGETYNVSGSNASYRIQNLTSGTNYSVSIWSSASNANSSAVTRTIKTYPECLAALIETSFTNSSISLNVSETSNSFDHYEFTLRDQNGENQTKNYPNTDTNVILSFLEAGVKYDISVKTVSGKLKSTPCNSTITARTKPNPPIVSCVPSERNISMMLMKGRGYIDGFEISCQNCPNFTTINETTNENASLIIPDLKPNNMYLIKVRTRAGDHYSEEVICNATTDWGPPTGVRELKFKEVKNNVVNLTWKKPAEENGYIRWYLGEVNGMEVGTNENHSENFNTSEQSYELTVKAGYSYNITVRAFTIAPGPAEIINFTSKTYAPEFKPNVSPKPNKTGTVEKNSFTVEFPANPFSEDNGRILNYTVIVSTTNDPNETQQQSVLPNWYQFEHNASINSYQVISNCTNLYKPDNMCNPKTVADRTKRSTEPQPVKFQIGAKDCSKENASYCNGYLKPNTNYYVKVRAYTWDAYQDTPYTEVIKTKAEETTPPFAIALAVICPLVTLFFAALAFYLMRKRTLPRTSKVEKDSGNFNMPRYKPTSHPVNLINFKDHLTQMSSDSDFRFAEEYEDLKDIGKSQDQIAAQLMCNRNKNRFANILPYDHSRVKLSSVDDEDGSDYVNANYLPGAFSRREYIVTQGPLASTRDDFWRMVSEQNVRNIVMLTRCVEKLREKCDHYWPESGDPIYYGDVQVAKLHETITPDWTIIEFKMTEGEKSWNLRHFHFTSWPDFGVPNSPQVLVNFVKTVRRSLIKTGPIIVHCSAGVGRSGTFIAVDHCMQHIQMHDYVDVLGIVHEMRMHRVLMVQTEQQYIYIHHCLLNALEASETEDIYQNVTVNQNGGHDNQAFLEDDEGIHVA